MTVNSIPSPPEGQDLAQVPLKFEVTRIPVTDFDRAKDFYQRLGWQLDIDLQFTEQVRGVQFTPPGSPASVQFGPPAGPPLEGPADRRRHRGRPRRDPEARHRHRRHLPRPPGRGARARARPPRSLVR